MVAVTPVPDVPHWVLGIINLSGQMVPVIDLRQLFGQASKPLELKDVLLIVQTSGQTVAIVVDEALTILKFASEQVQSPPTTVSQSRFVAAAVQHQGMLVLVLDELRLFPNNNEKMADGLIWPEIPPLDGGKDDNAELTR
jgi:purine-binding chemotaxis protein CheW